MFPPVPPAYAAFFANTGPSFQYAVAPGASVTTPSFKPVSPLKLDGKRRSIKKLYIPPGPPRPDLDEIVNWHSSEPRVPVPDNTVRIKVIEDPYFRASELPPIVPPPRIRDAAREELLKEVGLRWDMGMDKWYKMKEEEAMRQAEEEAIQRAEEAIRQAKEERKRLIRIEKEKEQEMWAKKVQRIMRLRAQQPVEPVNEAPAGRASTSISTLSAHQMVVKPQGNAPPQHSTSTSLVSGQGPTSATPPLVATATASASQYAAESSNKKDAAGQKRQKGKKIHRGTKRDREETETEIQATNPQHDERRPTRRARTSHRR